MQDCELVPPTLASPIHVCVCVCVCVCVYVSLYMYICIYTRIYRRSAHTLMSTGSASLCPQVKHPPTAPGPDACTHAAGGAVHGAEGDDWPAGEPGKEGGGEGGKEEEEEGLSNAREEEVWLSVFPKLVS